MSQSIQMVYFKAKFLSSKQTSALLPCNSGNKVV